MKKKIYSILLVILWMILIFIMSSFNSIESGNQSNFIVNIISNILNIKNVDTLSFIIRKSAHFTEYFVLGLLVYNLINNCHYKSYIGILICIIYALSDEIHQIFVPGRAFKIMDILIDSTGSITGLYLLKYFIQKKSK